MVRERNELTIENRQNDEESDDFSSFLSFFFDRFTRKITGWVIESKMKESLVTGAFLQSGK